MIFQYKWGTPQYAQSIALRTDILRKPLGLVFEIKDILEEIKSLHFGFFDECYSILACLYLKPLNNFMLLKQMAVKDTVQGKGIGRALILEAESVVLMLGYKQIQLHARETAIGFYEKLGYKIISEKFEEIGITHFKMEKKIKNCKKTY